ncbi:hypothetical protein ID866_4717 [Astraeus odoratus]|nr:hypothetical protein ID866_4717 [Astraeus odoratus]
MHPLRPRLLRAALWSSSSRGPAAATSSAVISRRLTVQPVPPSPPPPRPWFVDEEPPTLSPRHAPPHLAPKVHELPPNIPDAVRQLYGKLSQSPLLEPSLLDVREPVMPPPGPPLPRRTPRGRRRRGGTYFGEGIQEQQGGIWSWVVTAQVRLRICVISRLWFNFRKALLTMEPPLPLPPNSKRRGYNGWAMIDAGNFVVHILSRDARLKYFDNIAQW